MRAYITSIGEPTTNLSIWSLERQGFDVILLQDAQSSLAEKLKQIYNDTDDDFVRVDADVYCNKNLQWLVREYSESNLAWVQFQTFGWFSQDIIHGGVQLIKAKALPILRKHINEAMYAERPETQMFRLEEFHNPRICVTDDSAIVGVHGYGQPDLARIRAVKIRRGQDDNYDWELVEKLSQL